MIVLLPGQASDHTAWDSSIGPVKQYTMGFFHFSNNNLAIRKACAEAVGSYDPKASKSEDVDICFRVALSRDWIALRERGSCVRHKGRKSFGAFVKQMWGWGYHVGYPYAKTNRRGVYLYWLDARRQKITRDLEVKRFPFLVCLFVTHFHVAHVLLVAALIAGMLFGEVLLALALSALALPLFWRYLHDDRQAGLGFIETCKLALLHYVANVVFTVATIAGALKQRIILLPSPILRPRGPESG
jgi:Glycosyl transferase family group 2